MSNLVPKGNIMEQIFNAFIDFMHDSQGIILQQSDGKDFVSPMPP
jgi:hypothetical protein